MAEKITVASLMAEAVSDDELREQMIERPDEVVAEHGLTIEEAAALRGLDREALEGYVETLRTTTNWLSKKDGI